MPLVFFRGHHVLSEAFSMLFLFFFLGALDQPRVQTVAPPYESRDKSMHLPSFSLARLLAGCLGLCVSVQFMVMNVYLCSRLDLISVLYLFLPPTCPQNLAICQ